MIPNYCIYELCKYQKYLVNNKIEISPKRRYRSLVINYVKKYDIVNKNRYKNLYGVEMKLRYPNNLLINVSVVVL